MRLRWCLLFALLTVPSPGHGQGFEELFNTAALQRIDLLVNSRDWEKLKANFQENEYYPADVRWNGQTVRNVGIRSRGLGSRSGTKPGLRVDFNRYAGQDVLGSGVISTTEADPEGLRIASRCLLREWAARRARRTRDLRNNEYPGCRRVE